MSEEPAPIPGAIQAELTRLRAERSMLYDDREQLTEQLHGAQQQLSRQEDSRAVASEYEAERAELTARNERLDSELAQARSELAQARSELAAERERSAGLDAEVAAREEYASGLREELAEVRRQRDHLQVRLLDLQYPEPGDQHTSPDDSPTGAQLGEDELEQLRLELAMAHDDARHHQRELAATRATVSWRVTGPLRFVRRHAGHGASSRARRQR